MNLPKLCDNWTVAMNERKTKLEQGMSLEGLKGYEETGCYKCDGYETRCHSYINLKELRELQK